MRISDWSSDVCSSDLLSSEATVYASYGKGFKSGGFNPIGSREALIAAAAGLGLQASSVYVLDRFDKEVSTSWEVGAKLRLFDRLLAINGALDRKSTRLNSSH